jgi:hypothetical protein
MDGWMCSFNKRSGLGCRFWNKSSIHLCRIVVRFQKEICVNFCPDIVLTVIVSLVKIWVIWYDFRNMLTPQLPHQLLPLQVVCHCSRSGAAKWACEAFDKMYNEESFGITRTQKTFSIIHSASKFSLNRSLPTTTRDGFGYLQIRIRMSLFTIFVSNSNTNLVE